MFFDECQKKRILHVAQSECQLALQNIITVKYYLNY
jgi:hypothetical protein